MKGILLVSLKWDIGMICAVHRKLVARWREADTYRKTIRILMTLASITDGSEIIPIHIQTHKWAIW